MARPGRTIPVLFHTTQGTARTVDEDRIVRLLRLLDPTNPEPRELRGTLTLDDNADGTAETAHTVAVDVVVGARNWEEGGPYRVVFHAAEEVWRETTNTTDGPNSLTADGSFTVDNDGTAPAHPQIRVTWTAQRSADETTQLGWKYRVVVPVTNNGTRDWNNELIPIALGDTTALTTAKALASGNDVRVRLDGRELPRQLQNWDTAFGSMIVPLTLGAGETANLEIVYGNPQAGDPRDEDLTLDKYAHSGLRGYAAWDLGADTGTATAGGASTLTDSGKSWVTNRWAGASIRLVGGTSANETRRVLSNTDTVITVDRAWQTAPDATSVYVIWMSGIACWGGVRSAGGAGPTMTDGSASFPAGGLVGGVVVIHNGTGAGATLYTITANTATVLTVTPDFPTLGASSEYRVTKWGYASWYVDQVEHSERWRGRFRLNRHQSRPSRVWFRSDGIPGAWDRVVTLRNGDDYRQLRWTAFDAGGGDNDYIGMLDVRRKKGGDDTFQEEGFADGLAYYTALGIIGVRFDYDYLNEAGVGKIVLLAKAPGGEAWEVAHETTTTQATLTALSLTYVDLTPLEGDYPIHIAQSVWPADEVEIPDTADGNDEADVYDDETFEVYLDPSDCLIDSTAPSAFEVDWATDEADVYDLQATIAYGASVAAALDLIRIGRHATLDDSGEGGGWFHLPSGDVLVIDCDTGEIFTYTGAIDATSYTKEHAAYAAVVYERITDPDNDGSLIAVPSSDWMPLAGEATTTVQVAETGMGTLSVYIVYQEGYIV